MKDAKEICGILKGVGKRLDRLAKSQEETDKMLKETDKILKKLAEKQHKTDEQIEKLSVQISKVAKEVRNTTKAVAQLNSVWQDYKDMGVNALAVGKDYSAVITNTCTKHLIKLHCLDFVLLCGCIKHGVIHLPYLYPSTLPINRTFKLNPII